MTVTVAQWHHSQAPNEREEFEGEKFELRSNQP